MFAGPPCVCGSVPCQPPPPAAGPHPRAWETAALLHGCPGFGVGCLPAELGCEAFLGRHSKLPPLRREAWRRTPPPSPRDPQGQLVSSWGFSHNLKRSRVSTTRRRVGGPERGHLPRTVSGGRAGAKARGLGGDPREATGSAHHPGSILHPARWPCDLLMWDALPAVPCHLDVPGHPLWSRDTCCLTAAFHPQSQVVNVVRGW